MACWCYTGMKCESDLECRFWWHIQYSRAFLTGLWESQVQVGRYRVDALARVNDWRVAFELDGQAYHNPRDDRVRDLALLSHIDAVVHIPFAAMAYYPEATWMLVGTWFPPLAHSRDLYAAMSHAELRELLERCDRGEEEDYRNADSWLRHADADYEVYLNWGDTGGLVGSPKAFVNDWKLWSIPVITDGRKWVQKGWSLGCVEPNIHAPASDSEATTLHELATAYLKSKLQKLSPILKAGCRHA